MMTYDEAAELTASEKVTICIAEATKKYKIFSIFDPDEDVYVKSVDYFISGIKQNDDILPQFNSSAIPVSGGWFFDIKAKMLYVRTSDGQDPRKHDITAVCKFFWADAPYNLPHDLENGFMVEYEARIDSIGKLGQELDEENTGIVLESASSVVFHNADGLFDSIIDTLVWENQSIKFYSWFPQIPLSEKRRLFTGIIDTKSFTDDKVTFKTKDFIFRLKDKLKLGEFSEADGKLDESMIGKAKRRLFGQLDQVLCVGADKILDGFALTGVISLTADTDAVTGVGTKFLEELSPGDTLSFLRDGEEIKLTADIINSDTSITLGSSEDIEIVSQAVTVQPATAWQKKNRKWLIAGHKLREPIIEITSVQGANRVRSTGLKDLFAGDSVKVNDDFVSVKRISGNQVVFNQNISPMPVTGDFIVKNPVSKVFHGDKELVIDRDWSVNNTTEAWITLSEDAEFNIAPQRKLSNITMTFLNGNRNVTTTATIDLKTILKPRDWIRKNAVNSTWMEILSVSEQTIVLRKPFADANQVVTAYYKSLDLVSDDSRITVNCLGMEDADGSWVKTPADAVRYMILNDANFPEVNEDDFEQANIDCGYILSLALPLSLGDTSPTIKDSITLVNNSVFGSLHGNQSQSISYTILNAYKPPTMRSIEDHDVLDFGIDSSQSIINEMKINYKPYTDLYTGEESFKTMTIVSDFVNRMTGIRVAQEQTVYLYAEEDAQTICERKLFFKSLSACVVKISTKMNLSSMNVNDKIMMNFDRLYKRYGGGDKVKVAIVSAIRRTGRDTELDFSDLGNIFNRVPAIAPDEMEDYESSNRDQVARYGYIVDDDTFTPDNTSEAELGNNLIG